MKTRVKAVLLTGLASSLALLLVAPASALPILDLELKRAPGPSVPITHSDERLAYEAVVTNIASESPEVGTELTCEIESVGGAPPPTVEIEWLSNGETIEGTKGPAASAATYTITPTDAGKSLQCLVTATSDPDGAGTAFAPISSTRVSLPPIAVEPASSPAAPSGETRPGTTGARATPSGTATVTKDSNVLTNVITAEGTGDITNGSNVIEDVKTTKGAFFVEINQQTILGPGILAGTKIIAVEEPSSGILKLTLSQNATATSGDAVIKAGAIPFLNNQQINGAGIPPGTMVTGVSGLDVTISNNATASDTEVPVTGTSTRTCSAPVGWTGTGLTWSFQWLHNGVPIPGATNATYVVQSTDTEPPSVLQCRATAKDAAGNEAVAISPLSTTDPSPPMPYISPFIGLVGATFNNKTEGPVTVEAELPEGTQVLRAAGNEGGKVWSCAKQPQVRPTSVKCTRSDSLPPGTSYPPIELIAQVHRDAPDTLVTKASVSGGGASAPTTAEDTVSGILPAVPWGFKAFETSALDSLGDEFEQAGGHPFSAGAKLEFNDHIRAEAAEFGFRKVNGAVRVVKTDVPPGFVGNPEAMGEKCETVADVMAVPTTCPAASVVGGINVETASGFFVGLPIYAIEPERGTPAQFAFAVTIILPGFAYTLTPELRPGDGYAISLVTAPIQKSPPFFGADATLCGFGAEVGPSSTISGETEFKRCLEPGESGATERPFLTMPTKCGDPASATTHIYADTWEAPGSYAHDEHTLEAPQGCSALNFQANLKARPTTNQADSPTGLDFDLTIPQNEDPEGTATAHLKKAVIALPEGLAVNPSSANGLGACSPSEIGLGTNDPNTCPDASKLGTVQVTTPILDHPLPGALYLATPHQNPFNSLLALYLVVEDPETGITIKLPGKVETDPVTGQITSSFDENPEAPVERVELKLRSGAAAPLRTPVSCGKYSTTSSLTPWSAPESGPPATPKDNWQISRGPGGAACASSPPNTPAFEAGTASPIAAAYSPFVLRLSRQDGSQQFSAVNVTPPPGLLANLSGVPYCPESALAAARARSGKEEQATPSCPAASRVGSVVAGAGAGPAPYNAPGTAYLTGPYKGAPLSLAIITPAVAGPFDLGNVVVRTALRVDPETARVSAVSDPLPTILQGIPLDVRSVAVSLDRPGFTLNPTSCDPMAVSGELTSTLGQIAPLSQRFQVAECSRLGFKPKLAISLKGKTKRGGHPALKAVLTYPKGTYANIARTSVALPHSEFLAQDHIRTICTRVQFAADQCPKGSIYGKATATTPLLDQPLSGPVYLRSSSNPLPDMVVDLRGQIHVALVGRIDSHKGGIRTTFDSVPDAPVSRFVLQMQGAKKGLLENSRDICKHVNRVTASFTAHNGKELQARPLLKAKCGKKARKGKQNRKGHRRR
jgi:hypothetical protein